MASTSPVNPMIFETTAVWLPRQKYEEAECVYRAYLARHGGKSVAPTSSPTTPRSTGKPNAACEKKKSDSELMNQMENMRSKISNVLRSNSPVVREPSSGRAENVNDQILSLRKELTQVAGELKASVSRLEERVKTLEAQVLSREAGDNVRPTSVRAAACSVEPPAVPSTAVDKDDDDDDDDIDLFGDDDDEDPEAERLKAERIQMYAEKKSKKAAVIAKSSLILDVKPWDDETDMVKLESCVRSIVMDGLVWGSSKLVPVGYGIRKLQIMCVIEDDKISTEDLEEAITAFDDYIQSMDIVAFNKV